MQALMGGNDFFAFIDRKYCTAGRDILLYFIYTQLRVFDLSLERMSDMQKRKSDFRKLNDRISLQN